MITKELAEIARPGGQRRDDNGADNAVCHLGWIVMCHVCRKWRDIVTQLPSLWAEEIFAFANWEAIEWILSFTGKHAITLDFDRLTAAARRRDILDILVGIFRQDSRFFQRAKAIHCTLNRGTGLVMPANYSANILSTDSFYEDLYDILCEELVVLTIPLTSSHLGWCAGSLPDLSNKLTSLRLIRAEVVHYVDRARTYPHLRGYHTKLVCEEESWGHLADLLHFLRQNPQLSQLHVVDGFFTDYPRQDSEHNDMTPVHCPSLVDMKIVTLSMSSVSQLLDHIHTPKPWEIMTRHVAPEGAPPLFKGKVDEGDTLTITHSTRFYLHLSRSSHISPHTHRDVTLADARYKQFNTHAISTGLTLACGDVVPPLLNDVSLSLKTLVIGTLGKPRHRTWTILDIVHSVRDLVLEDDSCALQILNSVACPVHLTLHCRAGLVGSSGIEVLIETLGKWKGLGHCPEHITLRGAKRTADSVLLEGRQENFTDLREVCLPFSFVIRSLI